MGYANSDKRYQSGRDVAQGGEVGDELHAAYNFVPLADWVAPCPWADLISHDHPFADGISGSLAFEITNHTRLLVGGGDDGRAGVRFFRMPGAGGAEGAYAIPGSSLRGMLRNVLEIAAFARFSRVDDARPGFRDLASGVKTLYQENFSRRTDAGAFQALSRSAWLWFREGGWWLETCDHARVEHDLINRYAGVRWGPAARGGNRGWRPTASEKYGELQGRRVSLDVRFKVGPEEDHRHSEGKLLRYRKCLDLSADSGEGRGSRQSRQGEQGRLVLTGQPGPKKHMEFVFTRPTGRPEKLRPLAQQLVGQFLEVHAESAEWNGHWRPLALRGEPVPVFYLRERPDDTGSPVRAIGLSQMFKLPYALSLHDAIRNSSPAHLESGQPDFVEGIFGCLDEAGGSLRSRVSFSLAQARGEPRRAPEMRIILNGPKPSYYPAYIAQREKDGRLQSGQYATLMDRGARLRGWKRYPVRDGGSPPLAENGQETVASLLQPLEPGAVFAGRLRFHNLRPVELGAVLWAMTWGGDPARRHALGMGKPFGFGQISFRLGEADWDVNDGRPAPDPAGLMAAFGEHMEAAARAAGKPGWLASPQMRELLAMADPAQAAGKDLTHMRLKNPAGRNEFVQAKGGRGMPALALPAFTRTPRK